MFGRMERIRPEPPHGVSSSWIILSVDSTECSIEAARLSCQSMKSADGEGQVEAAETNAVAQDARVEHIRDSRNNNAQAFHDSASDHRAAAIFVVEPRGAL